MPDRERKRVPDERSDILKGSLPKSPPAYPCDHTKLEKFDRNSLQQKARTNVLAMVSLVLSLSHSHKQ